MLKKVILSVAAATLTFACMSASAVFDVNVAIDRDTAEAVVSGGGSEIAGQMLSLYCLSEGKSLSRAQQEQYEVQSSDLFEAIAFTEADKDGNFAFSELAPKSGKGTYVFYVKAYGQAEAVQSESIYISDQQTVDEFVSSVSGKNAEDVLAAVLEEEKTGAAGAQTALFELLSDDGKAKAASLVSGKTFSSLTQVENAVNDAAAQVGMLNPSDGAALDIFMFPQKNDLKAALAELVTKYNGMDKHLANSAVKVLSGLGPSARISVLNNAVKAGYDTTETMLERIGICVINYEFANASGYGDITEILKSHCADVLSEFDYNSYTSSKYLNSINKSLLSKSFSSADELISYIKDYKPSDTGGGSGGSGSSGGSSGSGSFGQSGIRDVLNGLSNLSFDDMTGFEWANDAVSYLRNKGIVSGRDSSHFNPSESVTREEFVKMAVVAFAVHNTEAVCSFDDVKTGEWYESFVASAAESGLVRGISETEFGIGSRITRQDVAVIIARAKGGAEISEEAPDAYTGFADNSEIAAYARASVKWMKEKGYINGFSDGSFAPNSFCIRAEAAKIIYEAIR